MKIVVAYDSRRLAIFAFGFDKKAPNFDKGVPEGEVYLLHVYLL